MMASELNANRQKIESFTDDLPERSTTLRRCALRAARSVCAAAGESIHAQYIENQW